MIIEKKKKNVEAKKFSKDKTKKARKEEEEKEDPMVQNSLSTSMLK